MHYLRHRRAVRKQGGFIQGAILFALVIIAVVVAAFSLANRDSQNNADTEQARVNASYVLKVGNDLQSAVNRAVADGLLPSQVSATIKFDTTASGATAINLFDNDLKYLTRPEFPPTSLEKNAPQPFRGTDGVGTNATAGFAADTALLNVGSAAGKEAIVQFSGISKQVCQRVNATVNGSLVTADPPTFAQATDVAGKGWREGCYGGGTAPATYTYFRAVVTDAS